MTIASEQKIWTDQEFMALPKDSGRYELVNGELMDRNNSGMEHGYIASNLIILLGGLVRSQKPGVVCDSSTAFALKARNKQISNFAQQPHVSQSTGC
ncbi:MAG: Uma2 family endonuclease [Elainella sp.]